MKINEEGLAIIKHYEGCSNTVYRCPAGIPTIGFGSCYDLGGNPITMDHRDITDEEATAYLVRGVQTTENSVARLVRVAVTENQFSSLVSFVYNVGSGNFQRSTMRMQINRGSFVDASNEFWKWRRAGGRILAGLVRRRAAEASLFKTPDALQDVLENWLDTYARD